MSENEPVLANQTKPALTPPYEALPGQVISLKLHIAPMEHRFPPESLNLVFVTIPEVQPPSTIPIPTPIPLPPENEQSDFIVNRIRDENYTINANYQQQVQEERLQWQQDHPTRTFTVIMTVTCDANGLINMRGSIPDPRIRTLVPPEAPDHEALYKGIYGLNPIQLIPTFPSEPLIGLDDDSRNAIAAYKLRISQDYFHPMPPPPPPPKTETITGLVIEPPRTEHP